LIANSTVLKLYPGELQIGIKERRPSLSGRRTPAPVIADDGTVLGPTSRPASSGCRRRRSRRRNAGEGVFALLDRHPAMRDFVRASLVGERR
jgi:hypothetical protein